MAKCVSLAYRSPLNYEWRGSFTWCTAVGVNLSDEGFFLELCGIPDGGSLEGDRKFGENYGDLSGGEL
jgi:hypothetical protein